MGPTAPFSKSIRATGATCRQDASKFERIRADAGGHHDIVDLPPGTPGIGIELAGYLAAAMELIGNPAGIVVTGLAEHRPANTRQPRKMRRKGTVEGIFDHCLGTFSGADGRRAFARESSVERPIRQGGPEFIVPDVSEKPESVQDISVGRVVARKNHDSMLSILSRSHPPRFAPPDRARAMKGRRLAETASNCRASAAADAARLQSA